MKYWTYDPENLSSGLHHVSIDLERDVERYSVDHNRQNGDEHPVNINGKNLWLKVYNTKEVAYECYIQRVGYSIIHHEKEIKKNIDQVFILRSILDGGV